MSTVKKKRPKTKSELHQQNPHRERYDLPVLAAAYPALAPYIRPNRFGDESVDFADPEAVKMLNAALLRHFYNIENWDIPPGYLCPPIPGRADYIHHIADLLASCNGGNTPTGEQVRCLDIGVGASCVYPIIGHKTYGWSFVGSDIDPASIASANNIAAANTHLQSAVECRLQPVAEAIFVGMIQPGEVFDLTICNPPFHTSQQAAQAGTLRKLRNLNQEKVLTPVLNFGGQGSELWCKGGEEKFVQDMIRESQQFAASCFWFSALIADQDHLKNIYRALEKAAATKVVTLPMGQGNKKSRVVAWTFLTEVQQREWQETRWGKN
ncbi:MAG: 23S rRNA (adenine(1618)-N(6))-methyltransferase RlmF [Saprospiraceae bacterium]